VKSPDVQVANFQEADRMLCQAKDRFTSAKLIFIGEAPRKNKDENGKPFVGAAGRVLSTAMEEARIKRSQVFITNLVRCRPPGNRVPEECEQTTCRPYLERQISLISPKIICRLGSTAYSSLLGGKSVTTNGGKIVKKNGQKYFLTFHPGFAIYNKNLRALLENDLLKLAWEIRATENLDDQSLLDYT
jgi:DNA polymerase